jgi:3-hydroxybutyryl-CoA dehydrogenase
MAPIERVGVVGCGLMGAGIAEVCARAGLDVIVADTDDVVLRGGEERIARSLERATRSGKLTDEDALLTRSRLHFDSRLQSFGDRQIVFEAVAEIEHVKIDVLSSLDVIVSSDALLASNTSSIPIARLALGTAHPERLLGVHFFNPAPVMPLVEIVPSLRTTVAVVEATERFVRDTLGKTAIQARDRGGFVVNALLVPFLLSAIRMVESGFADASTVDTGMEAGCAHPMGPLRLADLIGLDTLKFVAEALYGEYRESQYAPPPLLSRMVDSGWLGRKSGRGFYDYSKS